MELALFQNWQNNFIKNIFFMLNKSMENTLIISYKEKRAVDKLLLYFFVKKKDLL